MKSVFWFRRDLRLQDNEALAAAFSESEAVAAVYIANASEYHALEGIRQHSLTESLKSLSKDTGNQLNVYRTESLEESANVLEEKTDRRMSECVCVRERATDRRVYELWPWMCRGEHQSQRRLRVEGLDMI